MGFLVDMPILSLLGFSALFVLALNVYNGSVEYKTGEVVNSTSFFNESTNMTEVSEVVVNTYGVWFPSSQERSMFGIMFMVFSFVGFALVLAFEVGRGDPY